MSGALKIWLNESSETPAVFMSASHSVVAARHP